MTRHLTEHQVSPVDKTLSVRVLDEPGSGGANHAYLITGFDVKGEPCDTHNQDPNPTLILFQNGPIKEVGVNGITHEVLLAILCDRLRGFQSGPYKSDDNAQALDHMEKAMEALQRRTKNRIARGVEGTHAI